MRTLAQKGAADNRERGRIVRNEAEISREARAIVHERSECHPDDPAKRVRRDLAGWYR
jgi:hypothetical protein